MPGAEFQQRFSPVLRRCRGNRASQQEEVRAQVDVFMPGGGRVRRKKSDGTLHHEGHRIRDRRHDGMGEPTVATGKHGYVFRCGSPIFKLSFKNRFSSLPLRQFSQMLYAVAAA